jgi:hypothetical protein
VTFTEYQSRISQADEFDRWPGIIGIMARFPDEFALRIDWAEENKLELQNLAHFTTPGKRLTSSQKNSLVSRIPGF